MSEQQQVPVRSLVAGDVVISTLDNCWSTDYWLRHCEGFRVATEDGETGFVDAVELTLQGDAEALVVRFGSEFTHFRASARARRRGARPRRRDDRPRADQRSAAQACQPPAPHSASCLRVEG